MKPQLPGEEEKDAPDHVHVPALQGRLRLAVGYYSSVASGINKRSHVYMNAGPRASSRCQPGNGQLLVLSFPYGKPACLPVTASGGVLSAELDYFLFALSWRGCE